MVDTDRLLNSYIGYIRTRFKDDVALVLVAGSKARGDSHPKSDLDVIIINDTPLGASASVQFIIGDMGFDFFPISWERAEGIASLKEPIIPVILDSQVAYERSDDDRQRLESLRSKAAYFFSPEGRSAALEKTANRFSNCCVYLYNMRVAAKQKDLTALKIEVAKLVDNIVFILLLMNQTYYKRGWIKDYSLLCRLEIRPEKLESLIETIITSSSADIVFDTGQLLANQTRNLLLQEKKKIVQSKKYNDVFKGTYEEVKAVFRKIEHACEINDSITAFFFCLSMQDEFARFLATAENGIDYDRLYIFPDFQKDYRKAILPDFVKVVSSFHKNAIKDAVNKFDKNLKNHLISKDVSLNIFKNEIEFEQFLTNR